jgi:large subunit ribosomal protein L22
VATARDILRFSERDAAIVVGKLLDSAVANAQHNDDLDPEELYVSACFADEGTTIKRWRPRARGRATRIRKRTCHVTVIVSRLPEEKLGRLRARQSAEAAARRSRRVAGARKSDASASSAAPAPGRRSGTEQTPADIAAAEEAEGIVDPQAEVLAEEEGLAEEAAPAEEAVRAEDAVAEEAVPAEEATVVEEAAGEAVPVETAEAGDETSPAAEPPGPVNDKSEKGK